MWYIIMSGNITLIVPVTRPFLWDQVIAGPFDEYREAEVELALLDLV